MIGEYESYNIIQKHMKISESLYKIDLYGKHILSEIRHKKNLKSSKRSFSFDEDYNIIYENINDTINVWRFKSRLYLTLQYYLDEALFFCIDEDEDHFFIEDDRYELTKLYFGQEQWVRDPMIQTFSFLDEKNVNIDEAMILYSYIIDYKNILLSIESLLDSIKNDIRFKKKIMNVIFKIKKKHDNILNIVNKIITSDFNELSNEVLGNEHNY